MARKRMIDPGFWSDETLGHWSPMARLFYIGLWSFADDEGKLKAHKSLLKSQIFPYETRVDIAKLKEEVSGKVYWYTVKNEEYGHIRNFLKHQKINRSLPSHLPDPPNGITNHGLLIEDSVSSNGVLTPEEKRREEKGNEMKGSEMKIGYADFEKDILRSWNLFCDKHPVMSKLSAISPDRRQKIKLRWTQPTFQDFNKILDAIEKQKFCMGDNDRKWKVSFDWLIENDTNHLKIIELKYKDDKQAKNDLPEHWRT